MTNREIDALVAKNVMCRPLHCNYCLPNKICDNKCLGTPRYSTDISAAWEVVEKFDEFELSKHYGSNHWYCCIGGYCGDADTAPLAICKAALKVKGFEPQDSSVELQDRSNEL